MSRPVWSFGTRRYSSFGVLTGGTGDTQDERMNTYPNPSNYRTRHEAEEAFVAYVIESADGRTVATAADHTSALRVADHATRTTRTLHVVRAA